VTLLPGMTVTFPHGIDSVRTYTITVVEAERYALRCTRTYYYENGIGGANDVASRWRSRAVVERFFAHVARKYFGQPLRETRNLSTSVYHKRAQHEDFCGCQRGREAYRWWRESRTPCLPALFEVLDWCPHCDVTGLRWFYGWATPNGVTILPRFTAEFT
jgi:hypothetical protein